jgi:hypothetical protein
MYKIDNGDKKFIIIDWEAARKITKEDDRDKVIIHKADDYATFILSLQDSFLNEEIDLSKDIIEMVNSYIKQIPGFEKLIIPKNVKNLDGQPFSYITLNLLRKIKEIS